MKNYLFILFFAFVIFSLYHSCKREIPPVYPIFLTIDSLIWDNPDSALLVLEQISAPQQLKGPNRALYALLMTQARYKNRVLLKNDSLIQIAVKYYKDNKDKERLAKSYFYWGCLKVEKRELLDAITLFLKSLNGTDKYDDSIFAAMVYSHLGNCYNEQGLYSTARGIYKEGYNLCMKNDSVRVFYALRDIGDTFLLEYQLDSALLYYQESLKIAIALRNAEFLSLIYKNIAGLYDEQGCYIEAKSNISKALLYLEGEDYLSACSIKGDISNHLNQNDSAIYYWSLATASPNIYTKASSFHCLYQQYKQLENWKKATLYADSFLVFYDSIHAMNERAELDKLMDNHLVELHKHRLTVMQQKVTAVLVTVFLLVVFLLVILYLWKDRNQKKKYVALQQRLMENRAQKILLNETSEVALETMNVELHELEEERFRLCMALFETTNGYKMLSELMRDTPKVRINRAIANRKIITNDVRKIFADIMGDLKEHCPALTNDDLLYCVLSLLHCPKDVISDVMNVSADAIKTRKNRIKNKINTDLFNRVFEY